MRIGFRKSRKVLPGLRLSVGKKGGSVRIGPKNLGLTIGTKGTRATASVPGTGLSATTGDLKAGRQKKETAKPTIWNYIFVAVVLIGLWSYFH